MRDSSGYPKSFARRPNSKAELLGQIITPSKTATRMASILLGSRSKKPALILDPCVGPGTFLMALKKTGLLLPDDDLVAIDVDPSMANEAKTLQVEHNKTMIINADYLQVPFNSTFDYVIMNPPYVRQEWLDRKSEYANIFKERYGWSVPGTSNSYIYFIVKAIKDLKPAGRCVCIVYDSWRSTKYGRWLIRTLEKECQSFNVIPAREHTFDGRLIDVTILDFTKNSTSHATRRIRIDLASPRSAKVFKNTEGFATIDELAYTKRGLRLKQTDFFKCSLSEVKTIGATPFVKKSSLIKGFRVPDDHPEAALLASGDAVDPRLMAGLQKRLEKALSSPEENISILNWHREYPDTWYVHSKPPFASIIFNYYLRKRPRHIFNPTYSYSDNFYGLVPKDSIDPFCVFAVMNSTYTCVTIMTEARNQGNGLAKIQLYEYRRVRVPDWRFFDESTVQELSRLGQILSNCGDIECSNRTVFEIDNLLSTVLPESLPDLGILPHILTEVSRMTSRSR